MSDLNEIDPQDGCKHKPTGEWTAETVKFWDFTQIADAHNAALAAEHTNAEAWRLVANGKEGAYVKMEQQLDAEREKLHERHKLCVDFETKWKSEKEKSRILGNMTDGFREQLAAERQKVKLLEGELNEAVKLLKLEDIDAAISQTRQGKP